MGKIYLEWMQFEKFTAPSVIFSRWTCLLHCLPKVSPFPDDLNSLLFNELDGLRKFKPGINKERLLDTCLSGKIKNGRAVFSPGEGYIDRWAVFHMALNGPDCTSLEIF
jgi:hypothetical protein